MDEFWEKEIEFISVEDKKKLQLERLNNSIERAKQSDFYKKIDLKKGCLKRLDDIKDIPFTTKQDLRDGFPYGFLTVSLNDVIRLQSSSGTTGNPVVIFHTQQDINTWANLMARCMYMAGMRNGDIFQNIMGYGLFTGGFGFHYGAEKIGVMVIPIGTGNSQRQIWFLEKFKTTVMHILPSYALRLHSHILEEGLDPKKDLNLKMAFIGAEPHSDEIRRKIENMYGIKAFNSYGLSEMNGPGVAFECQYQEGTHIWEDAFYPEIIDPDTLEVLPDGEVGELVITTLAREAMPIIRYRTRDLTKIIVEPCKCGRTHRRLDRVKARSDDMIIINGVNIYPLQIEETLMKIKEIGHNYRIDIEKENYMDKLYISVELNKEYFTGDIHQLENIKKTVYEKLKNELGVSSIIKLVESGTLPQNEGKIKRVFDNRSEKGL